MWDRSGSVDPIPHHIFIRGNPYLYPNCPVGSDPMNVAGVGSLGGPLRCGRQGLQPRFPVFGCRLVVATLTGVVVATMATSLTRVKRIPMLGIRRRRRAHREAAIPREGGRRRWYSKNSGHLAVLLVHHMHRKHMFHSGGMPRFDIFEKNAL